MLALCLALVIREAATATLKRLFIMAGNTRADKANKWFLRLTALALAGFLTLTMWQLWSGPAAEVRMQGIKWRSVDLSIHDLAAIFMIVSLAVAVLTNTWPFFRWKDLLGTGRKIYLLIFVLMTIGILLPAAGARIFAPGHVVILLEWWEIALFAAFWGLETNRVRRLRTNTITRAPRGSGPLADLQRTASRRALDQRV